MKYILIFMCGFLLVSCNQKIVDYDYTGEKNFYNFYIVDTISIMNPVKVHLKFDNSWNIFYMDHSKIKSLKGKSFNEVIQEPDIFLHHFNFYALINQDQVIENNIKYYDNCNSKCIFENEKMIVYQLQNTQFILGLVNINFYNKNISGGGINFIDSDLSKSGYYKIVFPKCD